MFRDQLTGQQDADGSWKPNGGKQLEEHYRNCLNILMLEVHYRFLPTTGAKKCGCRLSDAGWPGVPEFSEISPKDFFFGKLIPGRLFYASIRSGKGYVRPQVYEHPRPTQ